jgi:hypothetical protein
VEAVSGEAPERPPAPDDTDAGQGAPGRARDVPPTVSEARVMARRSQELTGAAWGRLETVWRLAEADRLQIDEARAAIERSRRILKSDMPE